MASRNTTPMPGRGYPPAGPRSPDPDRDGDSRKRDTDKDKERMPAPPPRRK